LASNFVAKGETQVGWASYEEDVASRYFAAQASRERRAAAARPHGRAASSAPHKPGTSAKPEEGPSRKLKEFSVAPSRPLPVIILADTSGSMKADKKIDSVNIALADMLSSFREENAGQAEIQVAVITFGGTARLHLPLTPVDNIELQPLTAEGMTPMGAAFDLARRILEDRDVLPSRAYTPSLVLLSDGEPNDEWETALQALLQSERAKKAERFALGIGVDASSDVLRRFLARPDRKVLGATEGRQIKAFFSGSR
jgi:uncharacterized protein YegL